MTTTLPNKATPAFAAGLLAALALTTADNAWGDCWYASSTQTSYTLIISIPAQIFVPKDAPVGTVIYTSPAVPGPPATQLAFGCTQNTPGGIINYIGNQNADNANTFPTKISGVGFRWRRTNANGTQDIGPHGSIKAPINGSYNFENTTHALVLVKTGNINSAFTAKTGIIASFNYGTREGLNMQTNAFTIFPGTCETRNVQIDLGRHYTSEISSLPIGGTIGATDAQIPVFNCPVGAKLAYGMNPLTSIVYGRPSVITLDPSDVSAQGVGIMVTDQNGQNAPFGTRKSVGTIPTSGNLDIPIRVSLMRLGTVKSGIVSASIEFTLYYE